MNDEKVQKITACAFIYKDGKLFVARRALSKTFLPGKYELPGGHIEFGETMEDGLKREIMEELGFEINVAEPFNVFTYTRDDNTIHSVEVDYFATLANPNQEINLNPNDHSEFHWITKEQIPDFFDSTDPEAKAIQRGFERLK